MLQAFVSLKKNYPEHKVDQLEVFLDALCGALFSKPQYFLSHVNPVVRPYDRQTIAKEATDERCKFFVVRGSEKKFWQATVLLPDAQTQGAIFFDFEHKSGKGYIGHDRLQETMKALYKNLQPEIIRVGDSEAREKLKSRHGLVLMPGLGRTEWLQIVHPDVYSVYYSASELAAAPAANTEIWKDGGLFIQVYDDPKDWENEENVSHANMLPAFLAGIATVKDNEAEMHKIQALERLRNRAQKAADKGMELMNQATTADMPESKQTVAASPTKTTQAASSKPHTVPSKEPASKAPIDDDPKYEAMRKTLITRLQTDYDISRENLTRYGQEGPCTIFDVTTKNGETFYATYQDLERKVYLLDELEDFAKFLQAQGCSVSHGDSDHIIALTLKYHKKHAIYLKSVEDLPVQNRGDDRVASFADQITIDRISDVNGAKILHMWYLNTQGDHLEELKICQFEQFPLTVESKKHASGLESDEDYVPQTTAKTEQQADKPEKKSLSPQSDTSAHRSGRRELNDDSDLVNDAAILAQSQQSSLAKNISLILILIGLAVAAYFILVYLKLI